MPDRIKQTKYGLAEDPRGLIVSMEWKGQPLLGRVRDVRRDYVTGCVRLVVHYFCGDPWPLEPAVNAVELV